jgi:hypothetical protein
MTGHDLLFEAAKPGRQIRKFTKVIKSSLSTSLSTISPLQPQSISFHVAEITKLKA